MIRHPLLFSLFLTVLLLAGCAPTYPKEKIEDSVVDMCKREYGLDVKAITVGNTLGVYMPLHNLIDFTFAITKEASEKINGVLLSATRVAISTDAEINFYCVVAHDVKLPEIQVVIVKSVDDVKRFLLMDISRGEYSKRMLINVRLSPQAQKEKTIREIFNKMDLDPEWQEQVLDDFFRTEPAGLGELGYWNNRFYLKDVKLTEFMAEQMASRVKMAFKDDDDLFEKFLVKSTKGEYISKGTTKFFRLEVLVVRRRYEDFDLDASSVIFENGLKTAGHVAHIYKFEDFDYVEILDEREDKALVVSKEKLEDFRKRKVKLEDILLEYI